ncbi:hypothetical protein [Virgibacillus halodenitrificans]|uniref:DUF2568 domain-containing protein n=1 Tax=Virgibacillus halodenitrificans TaxID=1482 RepID=A0ABR7VLH1_VIRHA|nr:hypothetical protein [Virgibacillus halodenitrificans]MBD1222763.1 hypothetical protein [Virgibacillus halodenitrificans]
MRYFLYFIAFLVLEVILALIGINPPDWIENFIITWFAAYIVVHIYGLMRGSDQTNGDYVLTSEQALFRSFIINILFYFLILLPEKLAIIIVLVGLFSFLLMLAERK